MKKKILSGLFALVLLATAGFGVHKSLNGNTDLSDLALANVEALAQANETNPPISTKWSSSTLPCYDYNGNQTSKKQTICFKPGYADSCTPVNC